MATTLRPRCPCSGCTLLSRLSLPRASPRRHGHGSQAVIRMVCLLRATVHAVVLTLPFPCVELTAIYRPLGSAWRRLPGGASPRIPGA